MAVRIVVLHVVVLITLVLKLRPGVGKYEMKILLKLTDLLVFVLLDLFWAHIFRSMGSLMSSKYSGYFL